MQKKVLFSWIFNPATHYSQQHTIPNNENVISQVFTSFTHPCFNSFTTNMNTPNHASRCLSVCRACPQFMEQCTNASPKAFQKQGSNPSSLKWTKVQIWL